MGNYKYSETTHRGEFRNKETNELKPLTRLIWTAWYWTKMKCDWKRLMFRALDSNDQQFSIIYNQQDVETGWFNFVKTIMALANDLAIDFV